MDVFGLLVYTFLVANIVVFFGKMLNVARLGRLYGLEYSFAGFVLSLLAFGVVLSISIASSVSVDAVLYTVVNKINSFVFSLNTLFFVVEVLLYLAAKSVSRTRVR